MSKPVATLMADSVTHKKGLELTECDTEEETGSSAPYREAFDSFMYLMIATRPDLSFVFGKLSKICEAQKLKHFIAVKRNYRYLLVITLRGLELKYANNARPIGCTDTDLAGGVQD